MRGRNASMEEGNTFEQYVRTWRLAEAVADYLARETERTISFQDSRGLGFDDIVECESETLRGFQVKDKVSGIKREDIERSLRSLADAPQLSGHLVLSHMKSANGAPSIEVLTGLCEASRKARGSLRHLQYGRSEEECLSACATLVERSQEATFKLLSRLLILGTGPKAAVRGRAARTLAQAFEDPEGIFDRLLREVVDVAACGVELHAKRILDDLRGFRRAPRVWQPQVPSQGDALLWERDPRGVARTYWLGLDGARPVIKGSAPGLFLGGRSKLWHYRACQRRIPLALPSPEDPDAPDSVRFETVDTAEFIDLASGDVVELGLFNVLGDTGGLDLLEHRVELRGSFSSTAVIWAGAFHVGYMAGTSDNSARGSAIDLDHGTARALWTPEEAEHAVERYGRPAMHERNGRHGFESPPVELRQLLVRYGETLQPQTELQFAYDVCGAETDGTWNRYEASVDTRGEWLPSALAAAAVLPECIVRRFEEYPIRSDSEWGWTLCPVGGGAHKLLSDNLRFAVMNGR